MKNSNPPIPDSSLPAPERREFLGRAAAVAFGTAGASLVAGTPILASAGESAAPGAAHPTGPRAPLSEVAGKVAFITGGSSGIGLGMARAFSAAGMKVIFTYLRPEHRDQALGYFQGPNAGVHAIRVDVADRDGMERAADEAEKVFGPVHLLCNNAGIGVRSSIGDATYKDWDWAMGVNVTGVFTGIHVFLPRMRAHGQSAHIMATSSSGGIVAGSLGVYCATKFAVVGMMESLRAELEGQNIGVSVFCPGLIKSDIIESERNRPSDLSNGPAPAAPPAPPPGASGVNPMMAVAMDPLEAGEYVLAGIRQNSLYIVSHQEFAETVRERCDALLASFPSEPAPPARVEVVKTYTPDIYRLERDRLLALKSAHKARR